MNTSEQISTRGARIWSQVGLLFLLSAFAPRASWAGNKLINVQGKLTDSSGNPLTGSYTITFRLYVNFTDPIASAIWSESQSVTVSTGNFNVSLGSVTALNSIQFNAPYYLGMQVAGDANELSPRQTLGASAYAQGSLANFDIGGSVTVSSNATVSGNMSVAGPVTISSNVTVGGSIALSSMKVTGMANGSASTDAAAFGQVTPLFAYRRPNLVWVSSTTVDVEYGLVTGGSSDATLLFPGGQLRTDSVSGHTQLLLSQNAVWTNATEGNNQAGLRSGSVVSETWYAVYGVKVTTFANDWVMVADTVLPLRSNFSTLNSNFGTNNWVYLGMIRYGDELNFTTSICGFIQNGPFTTLSPVSNSYNYGGDPAGILMASATSATSVSYATTNGTSGQVIPSHLLTIYWGVYENSSGSGNYGTITPQNQTHIIYFRAAYANNDLFLNYFWGRMDAGVTAFNNNSGTEEIFVQGWYDDVLGVGSNPLM